jgi:hypothetical protein
MQGVARLWSMDGSLQQEITLQGNASEMPVSEIATGVYVLEIRNADVSVLRKKVFITR